MNAGTVKENLAKSRWGLLQNVIKNKRIPEPTRIHGSKRGFEKFSDIIDWTTDSNGRIVVEIKLGNNIINNCIKKTEQNININEAITSSYKITVFRNSVENLEFDDLRGYDKTGRICIWPAEQILSYWCLKNSKVFEGKMVIEIGGGFHCLAGLAIAKFVKACEVVLTDGDPSNLEGIKKSVCQNMFITKSVSASILRWDDFITPELECRFDQVIAADVVYDSSVFELLLKTVSKLLKPGGQFILFNPTRVEKLLNLIETAKKSELFQEIKVNSDDWDIHLSPIVEKLKTSDKSFNKDWHYPCLVTFYK